MLEIRDLFKAYHPKHGVPVKAVDGISLKFPETGMVFILGKSGSGKSTLLNLIGGLDTADKGEIVIHGKSSRDFRRGDFDSYRNTYLGFIFQEYNLLDDFNVGENVALALQLQGHKATKEAISDILKQVDLDGYATRKINELSGGQKQRVAIARALVKNPQIILADEPTGALDSNTGKQVFETLQKLSKTKLVICVSHDREFAEYYGDRVIEIHDGKVVSDEEKTSIIGKGQGLRVIDSNIIKITKGYQLTAADLTAISAFVATSPNDIFLSRDKKINDAICVAGKIDEEGNTQTFVKTDESKIKNDHEPFHEIKSRLGIGRSLRIGCSSLKIKPFRLVLTILLSFVAFGMFGLADTLGSFNKVDGEATSIADSSIRYLSYSKVKKTVYEDRFYSTESVPVYSDDFTRLKEQFNQPFYGVISSNSIAGGNYNSNISFSGSIPTQTGTSYYYFPYFYGLFEATPQAESDLNLTLIKGSFPQKSGEVAISDYTFSCFQHFGFVVTPSDPNSLISGSSLTEDQIIGKTLALNVGGGLTSPTICGIVNTGFNGSDFQNLINDDDTSNAATFNRYMLEIEFVNYLQGGLYDTCFISSADSEALASNAFVTPNEGSINFTIGNFYDHRYLRSIETLDSKEIFFYPGTSSLTDSDILIPLTDYRSLLYSLGASQLENVTLTSTDQSTFSYYNNSDDTKTLIVPATIGDIFHAGNDSTFSQSFYSSAASFTYPLAQLGGYSGTSAEWENLITDSKAESYLGEQDPASLFLYGYLGTQYGPQLGDMLNSASYSYYSSSSDSMSESTAKIKGAFFMPFSQYSLLGSEASSSVVCTSAFLSNYYVDNGFPYSLAISLTPSSVDSIKAACRFSGSDVDIDGSTYVYTLENHVSYIFSLVESAITPMSAVFFYIGIGFAVFASLMLFHFITLSIAYKKHEIGILRAVGARGTDVFGIFFSESLVICLISYALAIIGVFVGSFFINRALRNNYGLLITFFIPGARQIFFVLGVAVLVALISSFIPVLRISLKKPIDAIRDR